MRVLVVDDQTEISVSVADWFKTRGIACDCFHNGRAALKRFVAGRYSAVLLDVHLGGGITGIEVGERIRAKDKEVPIIVFSAVHYSSAVHRAVHDIGGTFVEKPVDMASLAALMGLSQ
jgi:DNA-binding response OmpR family regulator